MILKCCDRTWSRHCTVTGTFIVQSRLKLEPFFEHTDKPRPLDGHTPPRKAKVICAFRNCCFVYPCWAGGEHSCLRWRSLTRDRFPTETAEL